MTLSGEIFTIGALAMFMGWGFQWYAMSQEALFAFGVALGCYVVGYVLRNTLER